MVLPARSEKVLALLKAPVPITLRPSRLRSLFFLAITAMFCVIGFAMLRDEPLMGAFIFGFFGLCALVFTINLHPRAAFLILDSEGFTTCSLFRQHKTLWAAVEHFVPVRISRNSTVGWQYESTHRGQVRGVNLSRSLTGIDAALPETYGLRPSELADLMNELHYRYTKSNVSIPL